MVYRSCVNIKVIGQSSRSPGQKLIFMDLLDKNYWTIIHISETVWDMVTKFNMVMEIDNIKVMYESQGHGQGHHVKNVIFMDFA